MNVKYYTAFQRVVHWIKIHPAYSISDGAKTLAVVFDIPIQDTYAQLKEALK